MKLVYKLSDWAMVDRREGDMMPAWYYGYAYRDVMRNYSVFAVMPLNWLIRLGQAIQWRWNMFRGMPPEYELIKLSDLLNSNDVQYRRGYENGYTLGKKDSSTAMQEEYRRGYNDALANLVKHFESKVRNAD